MAGTRAFVESRLISDIDAMASAVATGLHAEYVQLETKRFTGRWTSVQLPQMVVQKGREDIAVVRRLRATAGTWSFIVPLAVSDAARWDACPVSRDELIVCAPGAECYAFDPGGTEFGIVSVPEEHPAAAAAGGFLASGERSCTVRQRGRDADALLEGFAAVLRGGDGADHGRRRIDRDARADERIDLETSLRRAARGPANRDASLGRREIVARAEAFFRRHLGESVSIARLSSVAGVSERSLRNAFYDVYTTGPKRYLRLWQLHQVRRVLRSAERAEQTVTDVATFHGFFELGRFAGEYKALFGEPPSETLQKARLEYAARALAPA
ncbi:MAG TPA: AraC family transcriptional regulator [Vicinamibacterales bacterium]|nr:AraC family transcriptional regulator [Vicinamibacterales bacterium]